jgi:hypothetical protein
MEVQNLFGGMEMDKEKSVSENGNSAWVQVPSPAPNGSV